MDSRLRRDNRAVRYHVFPPLKECTPPDPGWRRYNDVRRNIPQLSGDSFTDTGRGPSNLCGQSVDVPFRSLLGDFYMTAPSPLATSLPLHINWRLGCAPPPSTITLGAFGVPHTMELNVSADPVRWMLWILGCLKGGPHKCEPVSPDHSSRYSPSGKVTRRPSRHPMCHCPLPLPPYLHSVAPMPPPTSTSSPPPPSPQRLPTPFTYAVRYSPTSRPPYATSSQPASAKGRNMRMR